MKWWKYISACLVSVILVLSCQKDPNFEPYSVPSYGGAASQPDRGASTEMRNVMVLVSAGFNSLSTWLQADLEDLASGYLPDNARSSDVLVVLSRFSVSSGDYSSPSAPVLYRMYADAQGSVVRDTLKVWDGDTQLCRAATLKEALELVHRHFPAQGYGMVFSSHASGWLPDGYYGNPAAYEKSSLSLRRRSWNSAGAVWPAIDPWPAVKSIGQDAGKLAVEMELADFVDAIPFRLDYLLFDACLCGCVEVAWALRGKADIVGFSPTEILAEGFDYLGITQHLLQRTPDPLAVCKDYFAHYDALRGSSRSATISVVDTRRMDALAAVCATLFEQYRPQLETLSGSSVQGYFRFDRHFFYDLEDILVKAGITAEEQASLEAALDECVLYHAATPYFLSIPLVSCCGLSMYLPSMGTDFLDSFYRENIRWNDVTKLVL